MFTSSKNKSYRDSFSQRVNKTTSQKKQRSFKEHPSARRIVIQQPSPAQSSPGKSTTASSPTSPHLNSAIVTLSVGPTQRLFAAHEDVLCKSPYFANACRAKFFEASGKRIDLPSDTPEIFSAVLEYLYKGDYSPRLVLDKKRNTWSLDTESGGASDNTIFDTAINGSVLKDTYIYCAANTYALPTLQRLALKKQGLQTGVQCSTILSSARFAYAHTPPSDSKLRAHYLALIIRSRATFKRSGTMQMEMEAGGSALFFDLFVALVNHLDDVTAGR